MMRIIKTAILTLVTAGTSTLYAQTPAVDFFVSSCPQAPGETHSIWSLKEYTCPTNVSASLLKTLAEVPKHSQAHVAELLKGNVRISNQYLNMLEGQIVKSKNFTSAEGLATLNCLSGVSYSEIDVKKNDIDYFAGVLDQILYLRQQQLEPFYINSRGINIGLMRNSESIEKVTKDPSRLGFALSLKGGHLLGSYLPISSNLTATPDYEKQVINNVKRLKGLLPLVDKSSEYMEYPVFSISFDSYFTDGLCGKTRMFTEEEEKTFGKQTNIDEGFTPLGEKVIRTMLDVNEGGSRILVDVSDMSIAGRNWYYAYVKNQRSLEDTIPIIASHVCVNGLNWDNEIFSKEDKPEKNKNSWFNNYKRALTRQDIVSIRQSGGIIGLSLDKRKMIYGTRFEQELAKTLPNSAQRKEVYIKALVANMVKIVHVVQEQEAWDMITISSEFGELSRPFDCYDTSGEFSDLSKDLLKFFKNPTDIYDLYTADEIIKYMYDYTAEDIVRRITSENGIRFLNENLGVKRNPGPSAERN